MEHLSGKKERRSQKDKRKSDKLKGKNKVEPKKPKSKKPKSQQQKKWDEEKRKKQVEQGRYGLPGAGRGTRQPSKKDKMKSRKDKHKKRLYAAVLKVASENPEFRKALLAEIKQAKMARPGPFIEISGKTWRITRFQPHGSERAPDTRTIGELGWGEIKRVTKKGETTGKGKEVRFFKPPKISVETGRRKYLSQTYKDLGKTMPGLKSAELKTARTEFSDVARQVGQKLKARAIPVPFNRVQELKNYRDPRLELDTEAPPVAYLIKDIEYVERTMMTDSEGAPGDLEVIMDAILVPCVVKSNGRKAMLVLTYDGQSNPLSSQAYDEDYDIEPFKVSDVVKMIEGAASGVAWADEEANIRAASGKTAGRSLLPPPVFTTDEKPYFRGPGLQAYRAMASGDHPKWGHLANAIKSFEKYEAIRQKPGWEDPAQLNILQNGLAKLRGYMKLLYPTGKPKPKKKVTPLKRFLEEMTDSGIQAAVRKVLPFFKGHPAEAAQFADDVMEDANFHRESRYLDAPTADYSLLPGKAPAPSSVAQMLGFDNRVLSFAAALVSAAGSKRDGAAIARSMAKNVPIYGDNY